MVRRYFEEEKKTSTAVVRVNKVGGGRKLPEKEVWASFERIFMKEFISQVLRWKNLLDLIVEQ